MPKISQLSQIIPSSNVEPNTPKSEQGQPSKNLHSPPLAQAIINQTSDSHTNKANPLKRNRQANLPNARPTVPPGSKLHILLQEANEAKERVNSRVDQAHQAMEGFGTDEEALFSSLDGMSFIERQAFRKLYFEKTGKSFDSQLNKELTSSEMAHAEYLLSQSTFNEERKGVSVASRSLLQTISKGVSELQKNRGKKDHWNYTYNMGETYASQYFLTDALVKEDSKLDPKELQTKLLKTQRPDGSWSKLDDQAINAGDIDASVVNYLALKASGIPKNSPSLEKAKKWVLEHGGVERTKPETQLLMAMFGAAPWDVVPKIPYLFTKKGGLLDVRKLAQWVPSNFIPVAYLRNVQYQKNLGNDFKADELFKTPPEKKTKEIEPTPGSSEEKLILQLLDEQLEGGSWGAYGSSTMLSVLCLEHFRRYRPEHRERIDKAIKNAYEFVDTIALKNLDGIQTDGHYWDTALAATTVHEAQKNMMGQEEIADHLAGSQVENGGFPFGYGFETAPDTDDTAEIVTALAHLGGHEKEIDKALGWLGEMQNNDGGYAAFTKGKQGDPITRFILGRFAPASFFFDESSADVTGHVLEGISAAGQLDKRSETVSKAIEFLRESQEDRPEGGMWQGRWGVNYLYGTSAALVGLLKAGVPVKDPMIRRSLKWLEQVQNPDGGFGESTQSYENPDSAGFGASTPTQTAWALLPLIEAGQADSPVVKRGINYLLASREAHGTWKDESVTGTGHPGTVYLEYKAYPKTFPLLALARYREALEEKE